MNIRGTNLVAYLNTVKPESSRLAFMTLYIYYTSKGHDSCALNQENSQLQEKKLTHMYSAKPQCSSLEIN